MSAKRQAEIARVLRRAVAALPPNSPLTLAALRRTGKLRRPTKR